MLIVLDEILNVLGKFWGMKREVTWSKLAANDRPGIVLACSCRDLSASSSYVPSKTQINCQLAKKEFKEKKIFKKGRPAYLPSPSIEMIVSEFPELNLIF